MPRIIRHHLADFTFAAFVVTVLSSLACLVTPKRYYRQSDKARCILTAIHMTIVVLGIARGLDIERQDYYGLEGDPGRIASVVILDWLGAMNTETFDWWDLVAVSLGGLLVCFLQWRSTRLMRDWRRFPLFLRQPTHDR